jgi:glycosyltransferase involved in cell wall biosynthesis
MEQEQNKRIRILFLPKWYPHRYDPMPGLFVQKQAEALSRYCDISVLYVHEDTECTGNLEVVDSTENSIRVIRIYYRAVRYGPGIITSVIRLFRYLNAHLRGLRILRTFAPDLLHVHVLTRLGLIALLYKLCKGTPYIITEHWSRYFPLNGTYRGLIRKKITRLVIRHASGVIAVSEKLKNAMLAWKLENPDFRVIPNPVDMERFIFREDLKEQKPEKKIIIHISCFEDKSKNISGLLKILQKVALKRDDFECRLIGEGPDLQKMIDLSRVLGLLDKTVFFQGLKDHDDLSGSIRHSDFLVLSSNYETFGSVVIECLACGIPVLATDVGIVSEVLDEKNGKIVPPGDETEMLKALDNMLDNCRKYDQHQIRESVATRYDNKTVSQQLYRMYIELLSRKS